MSGNLGDFEGRLVGSWRLDSLLGARGGKSFYLTNTKKNGENVPLLVELVSKRDDPEVFESWNRAKKLTECLFLHVHAAGEAVLDGQPVAFAVLDLPEDDLGEVLAKRTLDPAEAKSTFLAVATALDSLHQRGLMHGAVIPSNIFMVKDQMRLSVDNLAPIGERGKASDLRQFGATLVEALTGGAEGAQLQPPFAEIADGCLYRAEDPEWTAARLVRVLSGEDRRGASDRRTSQRRAASPQYVEPAEALRQKVDPRAARAAARAEARNGFAAWLTGPQWTITVTGAIVAAVVLFYLYVHGPRPRQIEITRSPVTATPAETPPTPAPAVPPADDPATAARQIPTRERTQTGHWAVIAATYANFNAAQKRANRIQKQAPALRPHVYPHDGQGKHYFIVLGSGLSQEAAQRLLRAAREQGAPSDCYVTKLDES